MSKILLYIDEDSMDEDFVKALHVCEVILNDEPENATLVAYRKSLSAAIHVTGLFLITLLVKF
jgi:antitoxin component HigA of HigAB toxin-antitoxin module